MNLLRLVSTLAVSAALLMGSCLAQDVKAASFGRATTAPKTRPIDITVTGAKPNCNLVLRITAIGKHAGQHLVRKRATVSSDGTVTFRVKPQGNGMDSEKPKSCWFDTGLGTRYSLTLEGVRGTARILRFIPMGNGRVTVEL